MKKGIKGLSIVSLVFSIVSLVSKVLLTLLSLIMVFASLIWSNAVHYQLIRRIITMIKYYDFAIIGDSFVGIFVLFLFGVMILYFMFIFVPMSIIQLVLNVKHLSLLKKDSSLEGIQTSSGYMLVLGVSLITQSIIRAALALAPAIMSLLYKEKKEESDVEVVEDEKEIKKDRRIRNAFHIVMAHDKYALWSFISTLPFMLIFTGFTIAFLAIRISGVKYFTFNFDSYLDFLRFILLVDNAMNVWVGIFGIITAIAGIVIFGLSHLKGKQHLADYDSGHKQVATKNGAMYSLITGIIYLVLFGTINATNIFHFVKAIILFTSLPKKEAPKETQA